jgi:hypothetical protein
MIVHLNRLFKIANSTSDKTQQPNTVMGKKVKGNKPKLKLVLEKKKNPVVLLFFRKHTQQFIWTKEKMQNKCAYKFITEGLVSLPE